MTNISDNKRSIHQSVELDDDGKCDDNVDDGNSSNDNNLGCDNKDGNNNNKRRKIINRPLLQRRSLSSSIMQSSNNVERKKASCSSLFGAVMERSSTPSRANKKKRTTPPMASSSSSSFFPMSPSNRNAKSSNRATPSSPGGMELLKVLQGVGQDWLSLPSSATNVNVNVNKNPNHEFSSPTRSGLLMKEEEETAEDSSFLDEWNECPVFYDQTLDWSIKHVMKVDVFPASSSAFSTSSLSQQQALQYWQHPSIHPCPNIMYPHNNAVTTTSSSSPLSRQPSISSSSNLNNNNNTNLSRQTSFALTRQASVTSVATAASSIKKETKTKNKKHEHFMRRLIYSVRTSTSSNSNKRSDHHTPNSITFSQMLRLSSMGCLGGLGDFSTFFSDDSQQQKIPPLNKKQSQKKERIHILLQQQRQKEWKQCFQSLFYKWLSLSPHNHHNNNDDNHNNSYFYSTTPGQTILFRHQRSKNTINPNHTNNKNKPSTARHNHNNYHHNEPSLFQPVILLSSSTSYLREYLQKNLKITFHVSSSSHPKQDDVLPNDNGTITFQEQLLDEWTQKHTSINHTTIKIKREVSKKNSYDITITKKGDAGSSYSDNNIKKEKADNDDAEVQNDLEELRRATAHGEAVGEEYFVNNNTSNNKNGNNSLDDFINDVPFPPLMIIGKRDCLAFFEFYWNTCGCTYNLPSFPDNDQNNNKYSDVPLLFCPLSCGPCPFMTLKTLSIANVSKHSSKKLQTQQQAHSTIEIRGPIMPCALKYIVSYVAKQLLHHKQNQKQQGPPSTNNRIVQNTTNWDKIESILTTGEGSWLSFPEPPKKNNAEEDQLSPTKLLGESDSDNDEDNNVGSHYFVIQLHTHGGEVDHYAVKEKSSLWKRSSSMFIQQSSSYKKRNYIDIHQKTGGTGTPSSAWFNLTPPSSGEKFISTGQCNYGKVLNMIVWDITRPSKLAFKTESADSFLFQ